MKKLVLAASFLALVTLAAFAGAAGADPTLTAPAVQQLFTPAPSNTADLVPQQELLETLFAASAAPSAFCEPICLDPELTCCLRCWRIGSSCLCEQFCSIDFDRER
jgi:hypothetical protein